MKICFQIPFKGFLNEETKEYNKERKETSCCNNDKFLTHTHDQPQGKEGEQQSGQLVSKLLVLFHEKLEQGRELPFLSGQV